MFLTVSCTIQSYIHLSPKHINCGGPTSQWTYKPTDPHPQTAHSVVTSVIQSHPHTTLTLCVLCQTATSPQLKSNHLAEPASQTDIGYKLCIHGFVDLRIHGFSQVAELKLW